jgi:hypothetical protein
VKIQLLSDLHLEVQPGFTLRPAADADLLVLAGDVGSYQYGSRLPGADFGLERFSPLRGWPVPVLYVPGNHEYDAIEFDATHARLRETCERLGITWLERETLVFGGRRFMGTTLWSDFDALAVQARPAQQQKAREKAFRAANWYLRTTGTTRQGQPWLAEQVREQALVCQQWLRSALAVPFDGDTVVVTHFAPSLHSADPRYGMVAGHGGLLQRAGRSAGHWPRYGCTDICTAPATTCTGAAAWWPTRWAMRAKANSRAFASGSAWRSEKEGPEELSRRRAAPSRLKPPRGAASYTQ